MRVRRERESVVETLWLVQPRQGTMGMANSRLMRLASLILPLRSRASKNGTLLSTPI